MFGTNTPGDIWKKYMDTVLAGKPKVPLPTAKHVGRVDAGNATSPEPTEPTEPPTDPNGNDPNKGGNHGQPCQQPLDCQTLPPSPDISPSRKAIF
jgi:hypothetical protein